MNTLKKIRGYERKFANRADVTEAIVRALHERRAAEPAAAAPRTRPLSTSRTPGARFPQYEAVIRTDDRATARA